MHDSLTPAQRNVAEFDDHCVVLAGPGSGKTHMIVGKIAWTLKNSDGKIMVVTFTRRAANELKQRIKNTCPNSRNRVICGTFHSLALQQLKTLGPAPVRIARVIDEVLAASNAIKRLADCDLSAEKLIDRISLLQTKTPKEQMQDEYYNVFKEFKKHLNVCGLRTFADLIIEATIKMNRGTLRPIDVEHIFVDEAQDMDANQFEWLLEHVDGVGAKLMLVGDDDQSLYAWRNALGIECFRRAQRLVGATQFVLDKNFRNPLEIAEKSGRLINCGNERFEKCVEAVRSEVGEISVLPSVDRAQEIERIIEKIAELDGPFAILARNNAILREVANQLDEVGVTYEWAGKRKAPFRGISAVFLEILVALELDTAAGAEGAINLLARDGDFSDVVWNANATKMFEQLDVELDRKFSTLVKVKGHRASRLKQLVSLWPHWKIMLQKRGAELAIVTIGNWVKSTLSFEGNSSNREEHNAEYWLKVAEKRVLDASGTLCDRVDRILENADQNSKQMDVSLMTAHGSKGCEFEFVWLLGAEEGTFPSQRGNPDEERRLFYVAMTRTKSQLFLSFLESRGASRFLAEAGVVET